MPTKRNGNYYSTISQRFKRGIIEKLVVGIILLILGTAFIYASFKLSNLANISAFLAGILIFVVGIWAFVNSAIGYLYLEE